MRIGKGIIRLLLSISFCILMSSCSSFLYYPSRQLLVPPERYGLKPEEVHFSSKQGPQLFGWYFKNRAKKDPKAIVVFYHGNGENLSSHYLSLLWLLEHQYDFFIFDYQGYGRSEGSPSPEGTVLDGEAALDWVHTKYPSKPIVIFAQSLGGAVALRNAIDLKNKYPLKFIAVDSTFSSYRSAARRTLAKHWITWPLQWLGWLVMSDAFAPGKEVDKISPVPLLIFHGDKDPIIELAQGEEIFKNAKDPKEFVLVPGGEHTDAFMREDPIYRNLFLTRLNSIFKEASKK